MAVLSPAEAPADAAVIGGKALGLRRLRDLGLDVPDWRVVTTDEFDRVKRSKAVAEILHVSREVLAGSRHTPAAPTPADLQALHDRLAAAVAGAEPPAGLGPALGDLLATPLAVRSSAVGEDAGAHSFAGQFDTVLGVAGEPAVVAALRRCWASAWSARAVAYRLRAGLDPLDASMAVVIQRLVDGDGAVSGVLFTVDPADPSGTTALITSTYGLCEGVVGGAMAADTFRARRDRPGEVCERRVAHKAERLVRDAAAGGAGGTAAVEVPAADRDRPSLAVADVARIVEAGLKVERAQARPQDIEWTRDAAGRLVLLQARPITGGVAAAPAEGRVRLWDNSNIVESYPGVTTPLTFSFAHHAYEIVYRLFCEAMGVPRAAIQRNDFMFQSMIGLIRGRIYYNLHSWYRMFTLLPGYAYNRRFMEQMMGVSEQADYAADAPPPSAARRYLVELPRLVLVAARMAASLLTLDRRIATFRRRFAAAWGDYARVDFAALPAESLVDAYRDLERRLLWEWKAPIINDIFAMIFYGVLRRMVDRHGPADRPALHNDLLAGEGGLESVEPARAILAMAHLVRGDDALTALFAGAPDDAEVLRRIRAEPRHARLKAPLDDFLDRYGYRCMEELKLESTSLRDDPTFVVRMVRNYVGRADVDPDAMHARERAVRADAEAVMARRVPAGWRRFAYRLVLRHARLRVKERENLRFARTRVFGLARDIFNALGRRLAEAGALDAPEDVRWLTVAELVGQVEGTTPTTDLRAVAAVRRAEFARHAAADAFAQPDPRFETRGPVHLGNRFRRWRPPAAEPADGVLRGTPCCPGRLRLPARVVVSPRDDLALHGEILVAERTDPGWVPLFPSVSGLLVERGSVLSHSAIVAREMGLPTIVGIANLMQHVKDGQEIEMDGGAGTVTLAPG